MELVEEPGERARAQTSPPLHFLLSQSLLAKKPRGSGAREPLNNGPRGREPGARAFRPRSLREGPAFPFLSPLRAGSGGARAPLGGRAASALGPTPPRLPRRAVHTPVRCSRPLGDPQPAQPRGEVFGRGPEGAGRRRPLKAASAAPRRRRRRRRRRSPRPAAPRCARLALRPPLGFPHPAGDWPPPPDISRRSRSERLRGRAPRGSLGARRHPRAAEPARAGAPGRARYSAVASAVRAAPEPRTGAQKAGEPGAELERRDAEHCPPGFGGPGLAGRGVIRPQAGHKAQGSLARGARRARKERSHPPRQPGTLLDSPENAPEDDGAPEPWCFQRASVNGGALE
ncbi:serine/arginine repetitive matrix protein 3-like [Elephas maximus indicus]|uniref:serine/arginine repetitive matrix protein 3-like n=1 Tax=Elephas maximus indicus TaxID=99487 RepID=UPI0021166C70|nr:serine/arginine repetitive matrix protein 3-like [Elephas maximus indicus]